jgi:isopentenyl-diphosphate delta-isomerase
MPPSAFAPVSFAHERLCLVDANDTLIGYASKAQAHAGAGLLHRAFSIFLVNGNGQVLLQQRSPQKALWPGFWANSCCSHPREGETLESAAQRRLGEELGVATPLTVLGKFQYHARYHQVGSEHELCSMLVGAHQGPVHPHPDEIAAVRWIGPNELEQELLLRPERYTPWLILEWEWIRHHAANLIFSGVR